jgi:hypothetical protein
MVSRADCKRFSEIGGHGRRWRAVSEPVTLAFRA